MGTSSGRPLFTTSEMDSVNLRAHRKVSEKSIEYLGRHSYE